MFLLFIHTGQYRKCTCVRERGGHGIRKDLELGLFQGSPKAQPRYMHKAVGSNILSEFEETFLFNFYFYIKCISFKAAFFLRKEFPLAVDKTQDSPILYHRHGFCCRFHSETVQHIFTAQMYKSLVMRHISKTCFHRNYRFPPK